MIGSIAFAAGVMIFGYVIEMINATNIVWMLLRTFIRLCNRANNRSTYPPLDHIEPTHKEKNNKRKKRILALYNC